MEVEQNTSATSRRASGKKSDTSLAGKKRKKLGDGAAGKTEKAALEGKLLSRNAIFSSHFLPNQKTTNQQKLLILDNHQNPNIKSASESFKKGVGETSGE
eukprot:5165943-Ditylum_brightwellii.AAC.1